MLPYCIWFGNICLNAYTILIVYAFFVGYLSLAIISKKFFVVPIYDICLPLFLFLSAMFFSHAYWLLEYATSIQIQDLFKFLGKGHVFYGGLGGGVLAVWLYAQVKKYDFYLLLDVLSFPLAIGYSITRIGCFLYGCCYGKITDSMLGVSYPSCSHGPFAFQVSKGILSVSSARSLPVHPSPLYLSIGSFLIALYLLFLIYNCAIKRGNIVLYYLLLYSMLRFFVEFTRNNDAALFLWSLSYAQVISLIIIVLALTLLKWDDIIKQLKILSRCGEKGVDTQKGFSLSELIIVVGIIMVLASLLLPVFSRAIESSRRSSCQNNMRQWGLIYKMYASEEKGGTYPPIQYEMKTLQEGDLAFAPLLDSIYPEYLADIEIFICPSATKKISVNDLLFNKGSLDLCYAYVGWMLDKCEEGSPRMTIKELLNMIPLIDANRYQGDLDGPRQFVQLCAVVASKTIREHILLNRPLPVVSRSIADKDIHIHAALVGNGKTDIIFRLREGVERLSGLDIPLSESEIWVMLDIISSRLEYFNHPNGGANVLFMDGHASFVRYPSTAPVNRGMALFLGTLLDRHWLAYSE